jgi:hypothetical protein
VFATKGLSVNAQRVVLAVAAALGMICTFLPWVNVPFIGAVYGTRGDGCAGALVCALAGEIRAELALPAHLVSALIGAVVCLVAIWKIIDFNTSLPDNELSAVVSIGPGLYLLAAAGAAIALLPSLVRGSAPRQPPPPNWGPPPPQAGWPPQQQYRPNQGRWPPPPAW